MTLHLLVRHSEQLPLLNGHKIINNRRGFSPSVSQKILIRGGLNGQGGNEKDRLRPC